MSPQQNFRNIDVRGPVVVVDAEGRSFETNTDPDRVDYVTTEGVEVFLERPAKGTRGGQKTRFVDADGNQHGPLHANLVPAVVWAAVNGWRDPDAPDSWNDQAIRSTRESVVGDGDRCACGLPMSYDHDHKGAS